MGSCSSIFLNVGDRFDLYSGQKKRAPKDSFLEDSIGSSVTAIAIETWFVTAIAVTAKTATTATRIATAWTVASS